MLEFRLLGTLEVHGGAVALGSGKQRALLAYLLLRRNEAVPRDALVDALWGDTPPATVSHALDVYASRVRKTLGGNGLLESRGGCFRLKVADDEVDVGRFERLLAQVRSTADPEARLALADEALALWRGRALADVLREPFARPESERLEEERLVVREERFEALLALRRHDEAIGELQALVRTQPLRDRARRLLMLALYRAGRQSEALEIYSEGRATLRDELGLEPSRELRDLEAAVLRQDETLAPAPSIAPRGSRQAQGTLPAPATTFLGRERERRELAELLAGGEHRLLTLTGPGGIGKTRLALRAAYEAASRYPDGVWWVPLAALTDHRLVLETVAQVLDAGRELSAHIGERALLLLLDNFEQVVGAAPELRALLDSCPRLQVLVTSRESLRLEGEWTYAVEPLGIGEAVELFRLRAYAAGVDIRNGEVLEEICVRLDCLPLAVELAAARAVALPPSEILTRLEQRLALLDRGARDAPARQRTLRATIDWSYDLLGDDEQRAFARLSIFAGGWTIGAAESICGVRVDTLQTLIEKSLVRRRDERYGMLETIREYAAELLRESGEEEELARRHALYFTEVVERALAPFGPGPTTWLARLEADLDNFRAALASARDYDDGELFLRLAAAVGGSYWTERGDLREGRDWLEQAVAASESPEQARIVALIALAWIRYNLGETQAARGYAEASLDLARARGDLMGIFHGLWYLSVHAQERGRFDEARSLIEESADYARRAGSDWGMAIAEGVLGAILLERHEFDQALELSTEAARLAGHAGDKRRQGMWLGNAATAALRLGRVELAAELIRHVIDLEVETSPSSGLLDAFTVAAAIAAAMKRPEPAARLLGAAHRIADETGYRQHMIDAEQAEATLQHVRAALGAQFDTAIAAGRSMTLDDAVADALASIGQAHRT
jgi:predicted ATPase/DNA-binding SARP family transcriptional activator